MNADILKKMRERDKMKKRANETKNEDHRSMYRKLRNQVEAVIRLIRLAKRAYIRKAIIKNHGNSSALWKSLRYLLPSKKMRKNN